jgi:hypothetical protein
MRHAMSAPTTYEPDAVVIGPSFITSEEATLLASARAGDSAVTSERFDTVAGHRNRLTAIV